MNREREKIQLLFSAIRDNGILKRVAVSFVIISFIFTLILPPDISNAKTVFSAIEGIEMPEPGKMVQLSNKFTPSLLKGIVIFPSDPFRFDFIVDGGDDELNQEQLSLQSQKLIKYFLAALTIPEDDIWVNLSPFEHEHVIEDSFGQTAMGRDLLAQDYFLKQLSSSLMYPEKKIGKKFWDKIYKKAYEVYGKTDIPVNTFNKVWIMPDKAEILQKGKKAYIAYSRLKIMLEEDYLALTNNLNNEKLGIENKSNSDTKSISKISSKLIKEIILPEIEYEVNFGKNFAALRQVYHSLILASWYKKTLKESIIGHIYVDQNKIKGVHIEDPKVKEKIYEQYLAAYKKGVYNYIKEDYDPVSQSVVPRKYFSGGFIWNDNAMMIRTNRADLSYQGERNVFGKKERNDFAVTAKFKDVAMVTSPKQLIATIGDAVANAITGLPNKKKNPTSKNISDMTVTPQELDILARIEAAYRRQSALKIAENASKMKTSRSKATSNRKQKPLGLATIDKSYTNLKYVDKAPKSEVSPETRKHPAPIDSVYFGHESMPNLNYIAQRGKGLRAAFVFGRDSREKLLLAYIRIAMKKVNPKDTFENRKRMFLEELLELEKKAKIKNPKGPVIINDATTSLIIEDHLEFIANNVRFNTEAINKEGKLVGKGYKDASDDTKLKNDYVKDWIDVEHMFDNIMRLCHSKSLAFIDADITDGPEPFFEVSKWMEANQLTTDMIALSDQYTRDRTERDPFIFNSGGLLNATEGNVSFAKSIIALANPTTILAYEGRSPARGDKDFHFTRLGLQNVSDDFKKVLSNSWIVGAHNKVKALRAHRHVNNELNARVFIEDDDVVEDTVSDDTERSNDTIISQKTKTLYELTNMTGLGNTIGVGTTILGRGKEMANYLAMTVNNLFNKRKRSNENMAFEGNTIKVGDVGAGTNPMSTRVRKDYISDALKDVMRNRKPPFEKIMQSSDVSGDESVDNIKADIEEQNAKIDRMYKNFAKLKKEEGVIGKDYYKDKNSVGLTRRHIKRFQENFSEQAIVYRQVKKLTDELDSLQDKLEIAAFQAYERKGSSKPRIKENFRMDYVATETRASTAKMYVHAHVLLEQFLPKETKEHNKKEGEFRELLRKYLPADIEIEDVEDVFLVVNHEYKITQIIVQYITTEKIKDEKGEEVERFTRFQHPIAISPDFELAVGDNVIKKDLKKFMNRDFFDAVIKTLVKNDMRFKLFVDALKSAQEDIKQGKIVNLAVFNDNDKSEDDLQGQGVKFEIDPMFEPLQKDNIDFWPIDLQVDQTTSPIGDQIADTRQENTYDALTASYVTMHMTKSEKKNLLHNANRLLKEGGVFVMVNEENIVVNGEEGIEIKTQSYLDVFIKKNGQLTHDIGKKAKFVLGKVSLSGNEIVVSDDFSSNNPFETPEEAQANKEIYEMVMEFSRNSKKLNNRLFLLELIDRFGSQEIKINKAVEKLSLLVIELNQLGSNDKILGTELKKSDVTAQETTDLNKSEDFELIAMLNIVEERINQDNAAYGNTQSGLDVYNKGGIDFANDNLNLSIKRDEEGMPLPVKYQDLEQLKIEGFVPIIINIAPIHNLPMILGIMDEEEMYDEAA